MQVQTSQAAMRVKPRLQPKPKPKSTLKQKPKRRRPHAILEPMPPEPPVKPPRKVATYADLLKVPDHKVAEILDGELHVSPRPAPPHALAALRLVLGLGPSFDDGGSGPGGWRFLPEPELHLGDDVAVPDLAAWRRERFPPVVQTPAYITVAPDWLCEVLSPSTERIDRRKKLAIYAREGVSHVWLINPIERTLENYRLEAGGWMLRAVYGGDDDVVTVDPFDAVPLDLSRLWG